MLVCVEEKHRLFKQQQFSFIAALERSREHAHQRTQRVSTVTQVQRYMTHHCNNATDRRIFSLFLDIMDSLKAALQTSESFPSAQDHLSEALDTCRSVFSPDFNFSQLQAHYPHDEVNRLSCNEARNYYSGVVSVIPVTLDLLRTAVSELTQAASNKRVSQMDCTASEQQTAPGGAENTEIPQASSKQSSKPACKAWKPAWKPPGRRRI
ncbi:sperm acrosome-associated protein 9 [Clarias gariepinus]